MNHFELFNLPVALDIDLAALKAAIPEFACNNIHPDKALNRRPSPDKIE